MTRQGMANNTTIAVLRWLRLAAIGGKDVKMADAVLRCPNCGARMVSALRGGVPVRECGICCGVFLHRTDFERILGRRAAAPNGPGYEGRHRRD